MAKKRAVNRAMAAKAFQQLKSYAKNGLPDVYKDWAEFMYDFYPDLPWKKERMVQVIKAIMEIPQFPDVCESVLRTDGFDLKLDFEKAITE